MIFPLHSDAGAQAKGAAPRVGQHLGAIHGIVEGLVEIGDGDRPRPIADGELLFGLEGAVAVAEERDERPTVWTTGFTTVITGLEAFGRDETSFSKARKRTMIAGKYQ